jgi:hypothetical protein
VTCPHQPPCSTLHLYHWGTYFIAARDKAEAEAVGDDYGMICHGDDFEPNEVPASETINVGVDEDSCQCHEDDAVEELSLTPLQWICRQREGNKTGFIVGEEW